MNCKNCLQKYQLTNNKKQPRVLIQCGHTLCTQCILNNIKNFEIICKQCQKINICQNYTSFPLNQTLIALLKTNQTNFCSKLKQQQICKIHNKKFQAFCQTDNQLLCLNCVLTSHKSHKVSSINQKVLKDKQILKQSHEKLLHSKKITQSKYIQTLQMMDQYNIGFKQYVFDINMLYKNIINQLKQNQEQFIKASQKSLNQSINQLRKIQQKLNQKKQFFKQLDQMYQQLVKLDEISYLNQGNKRIFIVQNCTLRENFNLQFKKNQVNRLNVLNTSIKFLQELVMFEKKKNKQLSEKKATQNFTKSSPMINKSDKKENDLILLSNFNLLQQSPLRFQKKISVEKSNNNIKQKQVQVLQVNLSEQYEKYQQLKNNKRRNPQYQNPNKHTKIQYEIKKQNNQKIDKDKKNAPTLMTKKSSSKVQASSGTKIKQIDLAETKRKIKNNDSLISSHKRQNSLSLINDSQITYSPIINFKNPREENNQNLELSTPLSINSFMNSSRFTIVGQRDESILKDSKASFTMFDLQEKIYHFGGLSNNSISCTRLIQQNQTNNQTVYLGINRNKCQCIILKGYNSKKCLILGGKDTNGQRTNSILEFDLQTHKISKSQFTLSQSISGFAAVIIDSNRFVIFGGSSSTSLKSMHEYKVNKNIFEIKKLASMINSRDELGFALGFDGFIYACGGINTSNTILNTCERYCIKSNKWTSISAMKYPRRSFTVVSLPNGIYAIGGHDGKSYLKSIQFFDFELQKWVQITSLIQGRFTHTAVATNDYQSILVFGGYQNEPLRSVEKYSLIQNKCLNLSDMESQRFLHCSIFIQN